MSQSIVNKLKNQSGALAMVAISLFSLMLSACATYYLTPDSLREQVNEAAPETYVFMGGVFYFRTVISNGIRELDVRDKDGNEKELMVTPRTSIRIYKKDGDYTTFYFDTMFLLDSAVVGDYTHFFPSHIEPIPFSEITKIEIQR